MKKCLILIAVLMLATSPAWAARTVFAAPPAHPTASVFQVYAGDSNGTCVSFAGNAAGAEVITAVPGVLSIVPGHVDKNGDGTIDPKTERWANFISASSYSIKNVILTKTEGEPAQCALPGYYDGGFVQQRGTEAIRLWWPLLYEAPGTKWNLSIFYTIPGSLVVFEEKWSWQVAPTTLDTMKRLVDMFHELPFGLCEIPLIMDEAIYADLVASLAALTTAVNAQNFGDALALLMDFEFDVVAACVTPSDCPPPAPTGAAPGVLGIVNTKENPACCALLVNAESLGFNYGIFTPAK